MKLLFMKITFFVLALLKEAYSQICTSDASCPASNPICDLIFLCSSCTSNSDCSRFASTATCNGTIGCVQCATSLDCYNLFDNSKIFCNSSYFCTEVCGDGINLGFVACDDGNLINGDGCNNRCEVETGWICFGGNPYHKDICVHTPDANWEGPNPYGEALGVGRAMIYFNQPMIITEDLHNFTTVAIIDAYSNNIVTWYQFTYFGYQTYNLEYYSAYILEYRCNYTFTQNMETIRNTEGLALSHNYVYLNIEGYWTDIPGNPIKLEDIQIKKFWHKIFQYTLRTLSGIGNNNKIINRVMYSTGILCIFSRNMNWWIKTMEWMQIISQLRYLNLPWPRNLFLALQSYNFSNAELLGTPIQQRINFSQTEQLAPIPFRTQGVRTLLLYNAAPMIEVFGGTIALYGLFIFLYLIFKWKKSWKEKLEFVFVWALAFHTINFTYLDLWLAIFLQFTNMSFSGFYDKISAAGAILFCVILACVPILTWILLSKKEQELQEQKVINRYGALYGLFSVEKGSPKVKVLYFQYFRKMVSTLFYVYLPSSSKAQILMLSFFSLIGFIIIVMDKPYFSTLVNIIELVSEIIMTVTYFFLIYVPQKDVLTVPQQYTAGNIIGLYDSLGWAIFGMTSFVAFMHIVYLLHIVARMLYDSLCGGHLNVRLSNYFAYIYALGSAVHLKDIRGSKNFKQDYQSETKSQTETGVDPLNEQKDISKQPTTTDPDAEITQNPLVEDEPEKDLENALKFMFGTQFNQQMKRNNYYPTTRTAYSNTRVDSYFIGSDLNSDLNFDEGFTLPKKKKKNVHTMPYKKKENRLGSQS